MDRFLQRAGLPGRKAVLLFTEGLEPPDIVLAQFRYLVSAASCRNGLRAPVRQIVEDTRTYYELTCRPTHSELDGRRRDRKITAQRKDAVVQSRAGYSALPPELSGALFASEVPLLKALAARHRDGVRAGH